MAIPRFRTEDGSSFCSSCNSQIEGTAVSCPNCGKQFFGEKGAGRCPSCGAANLLGSISCVKCGKMISPKPVEPNPPKEPPPEATPSTDQTETQAEEEQEEEPKEEPKEEPVEEPKEEPKAETVEEQPNKTELEDVKRRRQSLWELSEPFEKVIRSRRRRLAKINALLVRAKERLAEIKGDESGEVGEERAELEEQIALIVEEKEEIVRIEEGIAEMERIYRNLLALQEAELKKKQEALQIRLHSFEEEIEKRDQERIGLKSKEDELRAKEADLQRRVVEFEQRELTLKNQEKELKDKLRVLRKEELEIMKKKFMGESAVPSQKGWPEKEGGVEATLVGESQGAASGKPSEKEKELNLRITELKSELDKVTGEREKLKETNQSLSGNTREVKRLLKILDDLLEKLPDEEIKRFADSEDFRLYEKILELYEL